MKMLSGMLLFLNVSASAAIDPEVASIIANEFGFNKKWKEEQLDAFNKLIKNYM